MEDQAIKQQRARLSLPHSPVSRIYLAWNATNGNALAPRSEAARRTRPTTTLNARGAQTREAVGFKRALPGKELFVGELVAAYGFLHGDRATAHGRDYRSLATGHPSLCVWRWQIRYSQHRRFLDFTVKRPPCGRYSRRSFVPEIVRAGDRLCHRAIPTIPRTNESGALKLRAPNGCTASQHWALGRHDSPVEGAGFEPSVPR
jgi:hypothetical protein